MSLQILVVYYHILITSSCCCPVKPTELIYYSRLPWASDAKEKSANKTPPLGIDRVLFFSAQLTLVVSRLSLNPQTAKGLFGLCTQNNALGVALVGHLSS